MGLWVCFVEFCQFNLQCSEVHNDIHNVETFLVTELGFLSWTTTGELCSPSFSSICNVYIHVRSHVGVHVCAHACGGQKLTSSSWCTLFTKAGSLDEPKTGCSAALASQFAPGTSSLTSPVPGVQRQCYASQFLCGCWDPPSLLMLGQHEDDPLGHPQALASICLFTLKYCCSNHKLS